MNPQEQDTKMWRNRFIAINLVRIGGTVVALLGILLWQSDSFVEGGTILGFPLALAGLAISFVAPLQLARRWRTPPEP
ncbi:MAG TPA: hypothetical protein VLK25_00455 [Allosphingosinicella sp.]|nr:hypothetical protein [Allosphingosinicella sp.]